MKLRRVHGLHPLGFPCARMLPPHAGRGNPAQTGDLRAEPGNAAAEVAAVRRPAPDDARHRRLRHLDPVRDRPLRRHRAGRAALLDRPVGLHRAGRGDLARQPLAALQAARALRLVCQPGAQAGDAGERERALHRAADGALDLGLVRARRPAGVRLDDPDGDAAQRDLRRLRDACVRDRVPDP